MNTSLTRMSPRVSLKSIVVSLGMLCVLYGCRGPSNVELLEARLREFEVMDDRRKAELVSVRSQLNIAQREARILRNQIADSGEKAPAVAATEAIASVEVLKFNTLLTAGQNKDETPGDERFHAIVSPYDKDGDLVKVVGKLQLEAIDLSLPEDKRTIGKWDYTPEKAGELWHSGYLSSGLRFDLPWNELPQGNEVLLHVKMETADGRELTASHTVKIDPPRQLAMAPIAPVAPKLLNLSGDAKPAEVKVPAPTESETPTAEAAKPAEATKPEATKEEAPKTNVTAPIPAPSKPERPVPVLDLFEEEPEEAPGKATLSPTSSQGAAQIEAEKVESSLARPFPSGIQTSDNWKESTIPILR